MPFALVNNALLRTWALTLGEVANVLEAVTILVHLVLTCKGLLELHLLLHLDLFVGQDWVLAGALAP